MKIKAIPLIITGMLPLASFASDGDITFVGLVEASACTLNGFNGGPAATSAVMTLPAVTPASFSGGGGYAGMKDFTIDLRNCDISTMQNARVTFSGSPDTVDNAILRNMSDSNAATGVGIAILENNGTKLVDINGGTPSDSQTLTEGNTTLKFKVAYKANTSTPAVTSGNVQAKTFIDIFYQ
ncbi:fimbrial protein [Rahnella selenatireducens]|uniref:fimbrial protein n=1 Tax=Rahnella selenatireducens TaxID=3389797 RepID=UPI0039686764